MEFQSAQRCAFPPCTNSFPRLNRKKKYCSGCCRVKDFNRRKNQQEDTVVIPAVRKETRPSTVEPSALSAPPLEPKQIEEPTAKKGMSLAGVGEAAIGTAGMLLLKDQLFDKEHRTKLQQQMNQLLQQQAWNARQLQEIKQKLEQLSKAKEDPSWAEKLLI
jgi:hypothetical protein